MLIQVQSTKPLEEIERGIEEAAARRRFGIVGKHDLRESLAAKGVELAIECRIYELCNPVQAKKVLEANGAISTALPCRISVYSSPGGYTLASILPTEAMKMFASPEVEPVAREVEEAIDGIVREAAA